MKTHIQFISTSFPPDPDEADLINEGVYGRKLAEFISSRLPRYGYSVIGVIPEDWGWQVQIQNKEFPLWIGCGNFPESENGFLCSIEPSKPKIRRWFRMVETRPTVSRLSNALEEIIAEAPGVTSHHWWAEEPEKVQTHSEKVLRKFAILTGLSVFLCFVLPWFLLSDLHSGEFASASVAFLYLLVAIPALTVNVWAILYGFYTLFTVPKPKTLIWALLGLNLLPIGLLVFGAVKAWNS